MKKLILFALLGMGLLTSPSVANVAVHAHKKHDTKETVVYITKTGEKYHRDGCSYLRQSKIQTTKKEAINNGYSACSRCKP